MEGAEYGNVDEANKEGGKGTTREEKVKVRTTPGDTTLKFKTNLRAWSREYHNA